MLFRFKTARSTNATNQHELHEDSVNADEVQRVSRKALRERRDEFVRKLDLAILRRVRIVSSYSESDSPDVLSHLNVLLRYEA